MFTFHAFLVRTIHSLWIGDARLNTFLQFISPCMNVTVIHCKKFAFKILALSCRTAGISHISRQWKICQEVFVAATPLQLLCQRNAESFQIYCIVCTCVSAPPTLTASRPKISESPPSPTLHFWAWAECVSCCKPIFSRLKMAKMWKCGRTWHKEGTTSNSEQVKQ